MSTPLVIGSGGVGLFLAHLLGRAGEVELLSRGETLEHLRAEGFVAFDQGVHHEHPRALGWKEWAASSSRRVVLVAVKAGDLASVLDGLRKRETGVECLFLLQNGLGILEEAEAALPRVPKVRVACYTGVAREGPNTLRVRGRGPFRIAAEGAGREWLGWLPDALEGSGFPVQVVGSPRRMEWEKAMMNLVVNGICTVLGAPNGAVVDSPPLTELARALVAECTAVAAARGVEVKEGMADAVLAAVEEVRENENSTLQDLRAGERTELAFLHGKVLEWAAESGQEAPVTRTLYQLLRHLEAERLARAEG